MFSSSSLSFFLSLSSFSPSLLSFPLLLLLLSLLLLRLFPLFLLLSLSPLLLSLPLPLHLLLWPLLLSLLLLILLLLLLLLYAPLLPDQQRKNHHIRPLSNLTSPHLLQAPLEPYPWPSLLWLSFSVSPLHVFCFFAHADGVALFLSDCPRLCNNWN